VTGGYNPPMVKTRFAPSPTGALHLGGVRTALYCYLYARRHGGEYLLRIEDTDRERSTEAALNTILEGLEWLGLTSDAPLVFQSQRTERYQEVLNYLLDEGKAYHCYCTRDALQAMREQAMERGEKPRYDGRCRTRSAPDPDVDPVVRFKNPQSGEVIVEDLVRGDVRFDNAELDDLIIARSDGSPTYNFTVVVDDTDMGITHVIRGDDHLNNTPRQINMIRALDSLTPKYAHLPMIHGADGVKLSKRHGALSVLEYRQMGYLPEALLNYLVRLGWSHGDQEIFSLDELTELFDLSAVNRSPSVFNPEKLLWVSQQHILKAPGEQLVGLLAEQLREQGLDPTAGPDLNTVVDALRERGNTVAEIAERAHCYFQEFESYDDKSARKFLRAGAHKPLETLAAELAKLTEWTESTTQAVVEQVAAQLDIKMGAVAQPLRVALVGQAASPGIGTTLVLVGQDRTLARIKRALGFIDSRADSSA
jgi:glutamyl-tRNA synthetase